MSKTLRILFALGLIVGFTFSVAGAQATKAIGDIYTATVDPGNSPLTGAPWAAYTGDPIEVGVGSNLWLGIDNRYFPNKVKKLELTVVCSGGASLTASATVGYDPAGVEITGQIDGSVQAGDTTTYTFTYEPQPHWEVITLNNASGSAITIVAAGITVRSQCPVPSLTTYGVGVLVLLLIGTTVYVVYRRRKAVPA